MNRTLEKIYFKSPVFLQNIAVSLYGLKLYRERYTVYGRRHLDFLLKSQWYSSDEIRSYQEQEFVKLARDAIRHVPYYRNWSQKVGISENDIVSMDSIRLFPILEKQDIRDNPKNFINESYLNKSRRILKLNTSGTSGSPLTIYADSIARSKHYAFFSRLRIWFGVSERSRRATLFGRIIQDAENKKPPFWRYDKFQNNLLMSSYHLNEKNLPYYIIKLREYQPEEIISYPSSIYHIAKYIVDNGFNPIDLKLIITTAEPLFEYQKEIISIAFNAPIVNQYGCTEMAFFGSECENGVMHFHPEHGICEVEESGMNRLHGVGDLIATSIINNVMPLIRYRVGDSVSIEESKCKCGRNFLILSSIEGRTDDLLYRRDGTPIGRLDPVFKGGLGIKEAQIFQYEDSSVEVFVVPDKYFSAENKTWLLGELRKRIGSDLKVTIKLVSELKKSSNGKFKAVVGNYNPNRNPAANNI